MLARSGEPFLLIQKDTQGKTQAILLMFAKW